MFASHFGMDGSPFQLSPDPKFYFDSHGHHRARAALRRGLSHASGFTVISGEIGAGKTTVVQAVLDELKPAFFAVAQIVSTQLDAEELLRSISIGFGLPSVGGDTASLAANLRRFLADLRTQRRRAILVVDEAQNLRPDAFDHLVAFAMRGSPSGRGMQICLVGQPELQVMVESRDLLAVREQICVSCHLGPIERAETGPYIAHRLHTVGWEGRPGFAAGSFEEIYRWTDGIPRRINSLCGRLMMACFMANQMTIGPAMVADIARKQLAEIGDLATEPQLLDLGFSGEVSTPAKPGPALFIVATRSDHVRAAAIMAAMAERVGWSSVKLVRVLDNDALALTGGLFDGLDWATGLISLGRPGNADGSEAADLHERFKLAVRRTSPSAVVAFGASDAVIACCAIARRWRLPIVHVGVQLSAGDASASGPGGRKPIDRSEDVWYPADEEGGRALWDAGISAATVHCVGDPLVDSLQLALRDLRCPTLGGDRHRVVVPVAQEGGTYTLVLLEDPGLVRDRQQSVALIAFLRRISHSVPLVLILRSEAGRCYNSHGFHPGILGNQLYRLPEQTHVNWVDLLRHARCVITDSGDAIKESSALDVPCLRLQVSAESGCPAASADALATRIEMQGKPGLWRFALSPPGDVPPYPTGWSAGQHIAEHLCAWLGLNCLQEAAEKAAERKGLHIVTPRN